MKNLLNPEVKNHVVARIDKLTPETKAVWGKMNVNQGLRHMTMAFDISNGKLDPTPPPGIPKMPKWLLKFFLVNVGPPKGKAQTFLEMNMVANNINPADFEKERAALKDAIETFSHQTNFLPVNKVAGKFSKNDWGKLNYNHTNYHLKQFGV